MGIELHIEELVLHGFAARDRQRIAAAVQLELSRLMGTAGAADFAKIPPATIDSLKTDAPTLTSILTYHVVPGQLSPDNVDGTHPTVQGAPLTVTGSGNNLKVNGASVICGGVHTANATVYMIDTVMMPPAR